MEALQTTRVQYVPKPLQPEPEQQPLPEKFQPKGAIAFFILMVILGLIIWFGIYFLMLERV
jgi:hypothetical protein